MAVLVFIFLFSLFKIMVECSHTGMVSTARYGYMHGQAIIVTIINPHLHTPLVVHDTDRDIGLI